jgi:hypothetical protein
VVKKRARAPSAVWLGAGLAVALTLGACRGPDLISLGGELPPDNERFLSPTGDDLDPGTSDNPWKTFGHALPLLQPGWTLRLLNGTYDASTTGTLNVRCGDAAPTSTVPTAIRAPNGELNNLITVRADGDRLAYLRGDGRTPPISVDGCQHWSIEGFYATSQDVDTHAASPDTGAVAVLDGANQDVALRRLLLTHPNRSFAKAHLIRIGDGASHITIERSELYDFHASAIEAWRSSSVLIARNYINSRDLPDLGAITADGARGDYGVRLQETSGAYVENNVVEDVNTAFAVVGRDGDANPLSPIGAITDNHLLGNVAYQPAAIGFLVDSQCAGNNPCDMAHTVSGTYLDNDVAYGGDIGVYDAGSVNTNVERLSVIKAARGVYILKDMDNAAIAPTCMVRDTLALGFQSVAFSGADGQPGWSFDHCAASGGYNPAYYYEPDNVPNITNKVTVTPDLGSCIVYLPANSVLRMGGGTVGANIIYQYDDHGQLTTLPLWGPPFVGCGGKVDGVNNDKDAKSSPSCSDVLMDLNVKTPSCPLPP